MEAPDDLLELTIGAPAAGGGCVARAPDGRVVFVRHALPGERVRAGVSGETTSFLRADAVEVIDPSPDRVERPCPYAGPGACGGCDYQHVRLGAQRELKAALVAEQLRHLAGIDLVVVVEEVAGGTDGLGWRTRVRFAVDRSGRLGFRKHRSHDLQLVDHCLLATPQVEAVGAEALRWPGASEVEIFASPQDAQRVVTVHSTRRQQSRLPDVDAGVVLDGRTAKRPPRLHVKVLGRSFQVSSGSFWQVHPAAPATLATAVIEGLEPQPGERVLDLYAGVGLFSALVGVAVGPEGAVLAVERDERACVDAEHNVADLEHVEVARANVTPEYLSELGYGPDLVVLDPARDGAGRGVTAWLASWRPSPRRLAYVACDPASFARDLKVLLDAGWSMRSLRAFDLFPMTEHVELVAVLEPHGSR
jgi:tRNA/tmRNA/rRNA uracil-C5-methylase (TrmA/RlmC/RlmD family)